MKVAIYCRVSTIEQNPENQKLQLVDYCDRLGYDYKVFEEKESTRKTRPVKYSLFQELRQKKFDGVVVWKLDRWARSTQELVTEINELYSKDVMFISLKENIDLSTPTGKLQFHIISAFAEFERDLIKERTLAGLERAKKQGKVLGRPKGSKDRKIRKKGGYYLRYKS